jgi:glycogen operon protein
LGFDPSYQGDSSVVCRFIYELHVRGFTASPQSGVEHPGTYLGLQEKIPYLRDLGITAVELMPVQEFNEGSLLRGNPSGQPLNQYWGYDPVVFCAPKATYSSAGGLGQQKLEFQQMVRAFHRAGIEVILDVVFNHTAEGTELGPTLCFRGIDNSIFYALADDKRHYRDYTGTGNTVNANHPVVRDHILAALRYWRIDMHIDGFRFDLASVLDRDRRGRLVADAPLLERIAEDPILRDLKIIAEAWDAAGAYQVGSFSERRWAEWNGRYRDDVRRFWRGDEGLLGAFASRLCGSADIYAASGKGPEASINFVTCHDGFTLHDLVSYQHKHNEANGEDNRDGGNANFSDNYGVEGPTADLGIDTVRKRQIKNFLLTLLISRGVPMLLGGDEVRRTQGGNNNAYCQDNATSWFNWAQVGGKPGDSSVCPRPLCLSRDPSRLKQGGVLFGCGNPVARPNGRSAQMDGPKRKTARVLDNGRRRRGAVNDVQRGYAGHRIYVPLTISSVQLVDGVRYRSDGIEKRGSWRQ